jgi:hypothetical protein
VYLVVIHGSEGYPSVGPTRAGGASMPGHERRRLCEADP